MTIGASIAAAGLTAGTAASTAALIGTAVSVGATLFEGFSAKKEANYQAKIASDNARLERINADLAFEAGQERQIIEDDKNRALMGEQLAQQAGSGLSVHGGSQILTRKSAHRLARKDAIAIRKDSDLEVSNFKRKASDYTKQSKSLKRKGKAAFISSLFKAGGQLIGAGSPTAKTPSSVYSTGTQNLEFGALY